MTMTHSKLNNFLALHQFTCPHTARADKNYPIHVAIETQNLDIVKMLMSIPVSLDVVNDTNQTALGLAFLSPNSACFHWLSLHPKAVALALQSQNTEIKKAVYHKVYTQLSKAHGKFFSIFRNRNPEVHEIGKTFQQAMMAPSEQSEVDASKLTRRGLIAARSYPIHIGLMNMPQLHRLAYSSDDSRQIIAEKTKWHNDGYAKMHTANMNWARLKIKTAENSKVSLQINPTFSQVANFKLDNVGKYVLLEAQKTAILNLLYQFTAHYDKKTAVWVPNSENEKKLASIFLECCKNGCPITKEKFVEKGLDAFLVKHASSKLEQLNAFFHLLTIEEIHRRLYPSIINSKTGNDYQSPLPMGIGVMMGLKLIAKGELSFNQFFLKDLPSIGPFTHDQIMSEEGIELYHQKMQRLIGLYATHFPEKTFHQETMHQQMLETFGGEDESDGETYDSDAENENLDFQMNTIINDESDLCIIVALQQQQPYRVIQQLINKSIAIDAQDNNGRTALHWAVELNRLDVVEYLLKHDANLDIKDKIRKTPIDLAYQMGNDLMVSLLQNHPASSEIRRNQRFQTPLHEAILANKPLNYIKSLIDDPYLDLDAIDAEGNTALHYAAQKKNIPIVEYLLEQNISSTIPNKQGQKALKHTKHQMHNMFASYREPYKHKYPNCHDVDKYGQTLLHQAVLQNDFSSFIDLIALNVNIDAQDAHGDTALHLAVQSQYLNFVIYLLNAQADANIRDFFGHTALYYAIDKGCHDIITFMMTNSRIDDPDVIDLVKEKINEDDDGFYKKLKNQSMMF